MNLDLILALLAATIQSGTPILYATLGEIITEKAGILNLGVEGIMLIGALAGFLVSQSFGSPVLGFILGGLCGAFFAGIHGCICLIFQGNQVVSGLALTILGTGLAYFLGTPFIGQSAPGFSKLVIPVLSHLPVIGPVFFNHDILVYISYILPVVILIFLNKTRWGLRLRAVGEYPQAALAAGVKVILYRWIGVLLGGFLVGLGGAYLSLAYTHLWTNGLTSGRGWIAVALVIFAFWHPLRAILGAYLFGGIMAFQLRVQALGTNLPSSILLMLPYAMTIIVLSLSYRKGHLSEAPASLGTNIEPEE
ncbi:ABC transporter permease [Desulfohalobiaceae bacterium Ax17]|uniref:ABC transporter permease n=1 Tax=Desulfovulcanus ferrireducens TaxID=2831190 RepID=UPI00207BA3F3|nr:ABC transporter permease [Desulfovulcanus ferrireducens]MBT8764129.1 ABC transporter permease [Desulfovulcanus ferrireducens]